MRGIGTRLLYYDSMTETAEPSIRNQGLYELWEQNDGLRTAHAELALMSVSDVVDQAPGVIRPLSDEPFVPAVDLHPQGDFDYTRAALVAFPWKNGWTPNMMIRLRLMQAAFAEPTRVIGFLDDSGAVPYTPGQLDQTRRGNYDPVAERQLRTAADLGVETGLFFGYSLGASVGAAALRLAARNGILMIEKVGLAEPPNVLARTDGQVTRAFMATDKPHTLAVNDTRIPALSAAEHTRGGIDRLRQLVFMAPMLLPNDYEKATRAGFKTDTFKDTLRYGLHNSTANVLYVSGRNSTIDPVHASESVIHMLNQLYPGRTRGRIIDGYGHEMSDHPVVFALLAQLAFSDETYQ